jgi:D-galacturonate reductase
VVGLCLFDLRKRGVLGKLHLAGTSGPKFPAIREHISKAIGEAYSGSNYDLSIETYPSIDKVDPNAYQDALKSIPKGSAVTIFTPDDTHFSIALDCVKAGMHVLVTKPVVKTLEQHIILAKAAEEANVLVAVEVHKRWDPIYVDARDRLRKYGDFSYLNAYMSQPKIQLETFAAWAGLSSDISYYLNSHHIDFHEWVLEGGRARPLRVYAMAAKGVGSSLLNRPSLEDTISVHAEWENLPSKSTGIATYTASWIAPKSDVHSQQRFFAMAATGEVTCDQAHRGYSFSTDDSGFASSNPLFMKYTPSSEKEFTGQLGYGYRSIADFILAVKSINDGKANPRDFDHKLASIHSTYLTTAILEAGRRSLDAGGKVVEFIYPSSTENQAVPLIPIDLKVIQ